MGLHLLFDVQGCTPKTPTARNNDLPGPGSRHASWNFQQLQKGESRMSENNKNVVRRLVEEVWNKGNLNVADELFTPNYEHHDTATPDLGRGAQGEKKRATLYRSAFPDFRLSIDELLAEGETVVARCNCRGTHKGELNGIAPTGKSINISGISLVRFSGGKMAEGWINWDALGMMRQLGVAPELAKRKAATISTT
jgi:predicted ester cyclase